MITRHTHGDLVWVDVVSPSDGEVRALMEEFVLEPTVAEELTAPSIRVHVDEYEDYLYLVLRFPAFRHTHTMTSPSQEIDFVVGKKWVITTRYETIDPFHEFSKVFEVGSLLDRHDMGDHAGMIFYYMLMRLYGAQMNELTFMTERLDAAEDRIYQGEERAMVVELSKIGRDLLNFSQALTPHREILDSLETPAVRLFGYEFARPVRSARNEYHKVESLLHAHHGSLAELRETNNSLLYAKQNEVMKILTIMAFVTFPLSLFTSLFGMNTDATPIIGSRHDFWIIVTIMVTAAVSFFAFFKYKKWL